MFFAQWPRIADAKKAYTQTESTCGSEDFTPWLIFSQTDPQEGSTGSGTGFDI